MCFWCSGSAESTPERAVAELTVCWTETDVNRHLVPGIGAHRIDKLEPEHVEKLYSRMLDSGLAAGTVHHAHRTLRAASARPCGENTPP